jgi:putative glycosyltransferase (TIGR04372 family)
MWCEWAKYFNPTETENPMIIDYATKHRTDFGDAFLPGTCDFFLGNTAGLFLVSTIMSRPVAGANFVPFDFAHHY